MTVRASLRTGPGPASVTARGEHRELQAINNSDLAEDGNGTLEFGGACSANTTFAADASGTLKIDDVLDFTGTVAGLNATDRLDLGGMQFSGNVSIGYSPNSAGTGGTLTVSDGSHTASIGLAGQFDAAGFQLSGDGATGTLVTYVPPSSMNPALDPLNSNNHVFA